ncbi:MAG: hypothetical protein GX102_05155 [Porphyromonadaceae bacterium]|nr:hypothetical protein [Porphyromonadaceae bacterium]
MCVNGYLESDNYGRWTTYKIKRKVDTSDGKVDTSKVATSDRKEDTQNLATSDINLATSDTNLATSDGKIATSKPKVATLAKRRVDTSDKQNLATSDTNLATSKIFPKRIKRPELERIIMTICKDQYTSKEKLAEILGKSENYLKNEVLNMMLKQGKLELKYPQNINNPYQAYKTTDKYAEKL